MDKNIETETLVSALHDKLTNARISMHACIAFYDDLKTLSTFMKHGFQLMNSIMNQCMHDFENFKC